MKKYHIFLTALFGLFLILSACGVPSRGTLSIPDDYFTSAKRYENPGLAETVSPDSSSSYWVTPTRYQKNAESTSFSPEYSISYPHFWGDNPHFKELNEKIKQIAMYSYGFGKMGEYPDENLLDLHVDYGIGYHSDALVSIVFFSYYTWMPNHPSRYEEWCTFDLDTGKELFYSDCITDNHTMAQLVYDAIPEDAPGYEHTINSTLRKEESPEHLETVFSNWGKESNSFYFTQSHFIVAFRPYQMVGYWHCAIPLNKVLPCASTSSIWEDIRENAEMGRPSDFFVLWDDFSAACGFLYFTLHKGAEPRRVSGCKAVLWEPHHKIRIPPQVKIISITGNIHKIGVLIGGFRVRLPQLYHIRKCGNCHPMVGFLALANQLKLPFNQILPAKKLTVSKEKSRHKIQNE